MWLVNHLPDRTTAMVEWAWLVTERGCGSGRLCSRLVRREGLCMKETWREEGQESCRGGGGSHLAIALWRGWRERQRACISTSTGARDEPAREPAFAIPWTTAHSWGEAQSTSQAAKLGAR